LAASAPGNPAIEAKLSAAPGRAGILVFSLLLAVGLFYALSHLIRDLETVHSPSVRPFVFLGGALLIALAFEFVNGFHDTANAVATVIYTHSLDPHLAVAWSGMWNFAGVLVSSGAVAFSIVSLLPVELILQVGSAAGFAMVFALLTAAVVWNLGTWSFGLPASSSHTLIGSIIGVGLANELIRGRSTTGGVDWSQALDVGRSLLFSPLIGFVIAGLLLLLAKAMARDPRLYRAPAGSQPPPIWIRSLPIFTCTAVSFAHGSNDGQKGMGLIMLILIGIVPTAYALNRAIPASATEHFIATSRQAEAVLAPHAGKALLLADPRPEVAAFVRTRRFSGSVTPALRQMVGGIANDLAHYTDLARVPPGQVRNFRNDLYLISEALRLMREQNDLRLTAAEWKVLGSYKQQIDAATKFIPGWVKVAVALALGLGTMVGWKRIVVTVGEKIGKEHLSYGQGAAAEITAAVTIAAADHFGLPVSTTHVLSSGVAGTMTANRSGLQPDTIRNIALAWVLTLPASIVLGGLLFGLFRVLL
jgi:PiT family inorganic phosphate transporter